VGSSSNKFQTSSGARGDSGTPSSKAGGDSSKAGGDSSVKSDKKKKKGKATIASGKNQTKAYHYDMTGHARQCVEKYLELAKTTKESIKTVATPCIDDHQLAPEDFEQKGSLEPVCARIVLKVLFLARMGRPDLLWTVNVLAREVTKWNVACDKKAPSTNQLLEYHKKLRSSMLRRRQRRRLQNSALYGRKFCRRPKGQQIY